MYEYIYNIIGIVKPPAGNFIFYELLINRFFLRNALYGLIQARARVICPSGATII